MSNYKKSSTLPKVPEFVGLVVDKNHKKMRFKKLKNNKKSSSKKKNIQEEDDKNYNNNYHHHHKHNNVNNDNNDRKSILTIKKKYNNDAADNSIKIKNKKNNNHDVYSTSKSLNLLKNLSKEYTTSSSNKKKNLHSTESSKNDSDYNNTNKNISKIHNNNTNPIILPSSNKYIIKKNNDAQKTIVKENYNNQHDDYNDNYNDEEEDNSNSNEEQVNMVEKKEQVETDKKITTTTTTTTKPIIDQNLLYHANKNLKIYDLKYPSSATTAVFKLPITNKTIISFYKEHLDNLKFIDDLEQNNDNNNRQQQRRRRQNENRIKINQVKIHYELLENSHSFLEKYNLYKLLVYILNKYEYGCCSLNKLLLNIKTFIANKPFEQVNEKFEFNIDQYNYLHNLKEQNNNNYVDNNEKLIKLQFAEKFYNEINDIHKNNTQSIFVYNYYYNENIANDNDNNNDKLLSTMYILKKYIFPENINSILLNYEFVEHVENLKYKLWDDFVKRQYQLFQVYLLNFIISIENQQIFINNLKNYLYQSGSSEDDDYNNLFDDLYWNVDNKTLKNNDEMYNILIKNICNLCTTPIKILWWWNYTSMSEILSKINLETTECDKKKFNFEKNIAQKYLIDHNRLLNNLIFWYNQKFDYVNTIEFPLTYNKNKGISNQYLKEQEDEEEQQYDEEYEQQQQPEINDNSKLPKVHKLDRLGLKDYNNDTKPLLKIHKNKHQVFENFKGTIQKQEQKDKYDNEEEEEYEQEEEEEEEYEEEEEEETESENENENDIYDNKQNQIILDNLCSKNSLNNPSFKYVRTEIITFINMFKDSDYYELSNDAYKAMVSRLNYCMMNFEYLDYCIVPKVIKTIPGFTRNNLYSLLKKLNGRGGVLKFDFIHNAVDMFVYYLKNYIEIKEVKINFTNNVELCNHVWKKIYHVFKTVSQQLDETNSSEMWKSQILKILEQVIKNIN